MPCLHDLTPLALLHGPPFTQGDQETAYVTFIELVDPDVNCILYIQDDRLHFKSMYVMFNFIECARTISKYGQM